jgi:hypothetical protein
MAGIGDTLRKGKVDGAKNKAAGAQEKFIGAQASAFEKAAKSVEGKDPEEIAAAAMGLESEIDQSLEQDHGVAPEQDQEMDR